MRMFFTDKNPYNIKNEHVYIKIILASGWVLVAHAFHLSIWFKTGGF